MTQVAEPVAVWDVSNHAFWDSGIFELVREWLTGQGVPVAGTYRVEIFLVDTPFARVFTYAEDDRGYRYVDQATGDAAVNDPFHQALGALPPPELVSA